MTPDASANPPASAHRGRQVGIYGREQVTAVLWREWRQKGTKVTPSLIRWGCGDETP